jgi:hypothetical protein
MTDSHTSDWDISLREARPSEREEIESRTASGEPIASDACIVVYLGDRLVGWGDDYGTFHVLPAPTSGGEVERAGEALLEFAGIFYDATN